MTVAISNGTTLWAARYGSNGDGPSLYHTANQAALDNASAAAGVIESQATIVVSEPLDECAEHWVEIPPHGILTAERGSIRLGKLALA
jgi:glutamine amidotransferase